MSASGRARPLSGAGVWSLLAWLRGAGDEDNEDSASSTSGTSDRTAASFAFLPPAHYLHLAGGSVRHLPRDPPTDTYRKRLYDGNLRRQYERDLTLHRKYLLPLGEQRYDACSLPPPRRNGAVDRDRRATSESLRRAHVPGKRRAPLPPRRRSNKRPAPPPPATSTANRPQTDIVERKEHYQEPQMSVSRQSSERPKSDILFEGGAGKSDKKDVHVKIRDKSFLKQIFESRMKRNSSVDVAPVKLLPSIRELDKQAAELLESYKLKVVEQNNNIPNIDMNSDIKTSGDKWFCTRCLKKYDATMITCLDCLSEAKVSSDSRKYKDSCLALKHSETQTNTDKFPIPSTSKNLDEKQKLKEMLKEMKHSLPKRPKPDTNQVDKNNFYFITENVNSVSNDKDTPTLPMGSSIHKKVELESQSSSSQRNDKVNECVLQSKTINNSAILLSTNRPTENAVISQTTVLMNSAPSGSKENKQSSNNSLDLRKSNSEKVNCNIVQESLNEITKLKKEKGVTDQSMKISTLLNPVYIPKISVITAVPNSKICCLSKPFAAVKSTATETKEQPLYTVSSHNASPSQAQQYSINKVVPVKLSGKEVSSMEIQEPKTSTPTFSQSILTKQSVIVASESSSTVNPPSSSKAVPFTSISEETGSTHPTSSLMILESNQPTVYQHSKRRDLITQLEKSIANGDEKAAAEAAIRLAQLRLSCSVLSFSSQIVAEVTSSTNPIKTVTGKTTIIPDGIVKINESIEKKSLKIDSATQSVGTRCLKSIINTDKPDSIAVSNTIKKEQSVPDSVTLTSKITNVITNDNTSDQDTAVLNSLKASTPKPSTSKDNEDVITVEVWIEDKEAARGPVRLRVQRTGSLGSLRHEAHSRLGVPTRLQRWIVGHTLCLHDDTPLVELAGPELEAPFYLCLVEAETSPPESTSEANTATESAGSELRTEPSDIYSELVRLERQALVPNTEPFECPVCLEQCAAGAGAVLRECMHAFCRECLRGTVVHSVEPDPQCPAQECVARVLDREVRALLSRDQLERRLARSLAAAESAAASRAFHCRTRDCVGWALCDPAPALGPATFLCPVCQANNCVSCKAIHEGETCEENRRRLEEMSGASVGGGDDDESAGWVQSLVRRGEALQCPECGTVISKQWGCDWVRCAACRTEICWATRGRRWGPGGKGDVSAGCRCGQDGKKCHPSCGYCH